MNRMSDLPRRVVVPATVALIVLSGCTDRISNPDSRLVAESAPRADRQPKEEATSSVRWSAIARDFISATPAATKPNQQAAFRAFAYLSLAQYRAVVAATESPGQPPHASPQGAVAAASTVVLSALFPANAAFFESQLRLQESELDGAEKPQSSFAAGEEVGGGMGAEVVEQARSGRLEAELT